MKNKSSRVDHTPLRRERSQRFSLEFSSPTTGRPILFWAQGSKPNRVVEFWPDDGHHPFVQMGQARRYSLSSIRKFVVYDRTNPQIRAVLVVDEVRKKDGQEMQPILRRRLEWDGPLGKAEIKKALGLVDEIARIERRGRPRRTGHPKQKLAWMDPNNKTYYRLKKSKCTYLQMKTVFTLAQHDNNQAKAAKDLGISPQAISKRIKLIKSKVQKRFPNSSL